MWLIYFCWAAMPLALQMVILSLLVWTVITAGLGVEGAGDLGGEGITDTQRMSASPAPWW